MSNVPERVAALRRFLEAAHGRLPEQDLAPAKIFVARVGERLALSRDHTVVALAGSTGTGKSSIFNALAGVELSPTGVRRPTTGETHACIFGPPGGGDAGELLDWLKVTRRSRRDAVPGLDGLVLLDLPDFDSVEEAHRIEADRLLAVADLIVWVLHPQKYADKVVHRGYLERFHRYRDITVVVLNQVDLLSPDDLQTCLEDLHRLLAEDGLGGVSLLTASTVAAPGLQALTDTLSKTVAARQAALRRLGADLDDITARIDLGPPVKPVAKTGIVDALAKAAGVPVVAAATEKAYIHRARKVTGWPPLRWVRRFRPDPLERLHLEADGRAATSIGPPSPAAMAGVSLAVREVAPQAGAWSEAVLEAARSRMDDLPDALDQAVARTELGVGRTRLWWRFFGFLQWIAVGVAAAGLLWLGVRYVMFALALPEPPLPMVGRLPLPTALLAGGLLAGLALSFVVRPIVRVAARRRRRRVEKAMRASVSLVAEEMIVVPAAEVVAGYEQAAAALKAAS